jgi:signal transduction histidine kinase
MRESRAGLEPMRLSMFTSVLLHFERSLREHRVVAGIVSAIAVAAITVAKQLTHGPVSLSLSYGIPLALCAYSIGFTAAMVTSVAVSVYSLFDAQELGLAGSEAAYIFLSRLATNVGIVSVAALAGAAARARERHIGAQQRLDHLRADLVAAFSHDLRVPLSTIAGYAELLRSEPRLPPSFDRTAALDTIVAEVHRVDRMIGDMLGAARSDDAVVVHPTKCDPAALVAELQSELDGVPRARPIALRWEVAANLPSLQTDRTKLISIVRNLVNNALKFTAQGTVVVRIASDGDKDAYRIDVEDTGPGIAPEALPYLFDRFYRSPASRQIDGFGLGLYIAKRFTELLGGSIRVRSELQHGTCFTVTIPQLLPPPAGPDQGEKAAS